MTIKFRAWQAAIKESLKIYLFFFQAKNLNLSVQQIIKVNGQ